MGRNSPAIDTNYAWLILQDLLTDALEKKAYVKITCIDTYMYLQWGLHTEKRLALFLNFQRVAQWIPM